MMALLTLPACSNCRFAAESLNMHRQTIQLCSTSDNCSFIFIEPIADAILCYVILRGGFSRQSRYLYRFEQDSNTF